jgi:DNA polymerase
VIIGEGPGRDEDVAGRPFVGRAGRLLDSALHSAKVRREDVFITNVVKCRPPRNRIPTKRERHVCVSTYLLRQLDMIGPNGVILLGRTASLVLLNERRLRDVRGKVITIKGMNFLPTYHPAAILRNPRLKRTFVSDLKKIHHVVKPKHKKET